MFTCIYYVYVCVRVSVCMDVHTEWLCVEVTGQRAGLGSLLLPLGPGTELRLIIRLDSKCLRLLIISLALSHSFR